MKKLIAVTLVLVLLLSLCAPAFAALPTAKFTGGKNAHIYYSSYVNWKVKFNCGSYNRVKNTYGGYIYRAAFQFVLSKGSLKETVIWYKNGSMYSDSNGRISYWGTNTESWTFYPQYSSVVYKPAYGYYSKWKVRLYSWYRPTWGSTVYNWEKAGHKKFLA